MKEIILKYGDEELYMIRTKPIRYMIAFRAIIMGVFWGVIDNIIVSIKESRFNH